MVGVFSFMLVMEWVATVSVGVAIVPVSGPPALSASAAKMSACGSDEVDTFRPSLFHRLHSTVQQIAVH